MTYGSKKQRKFKILHFGKEQLTLFQKEEINWSFIIFRHYLRLF